MDRQQCCLVSSLFGLASSTYLEATKPLEAEAETGGMLPNLG